MKYIILLLLLTACAKHQAVYSVDPAFQPYVAAFLNDAKTHGITPQTTDFSESWIFTVEFGDLPDTEYGICRIEENADLVLGTTWSKRIYINPKHWATATEDNKQDVIYHEMAHCSLGLKHDDSDVTFTVNGFSYQAPKSIMHSVGVSWRIPDHYAAFRQYYIDQVFNSNLVPPVK